ncbi:hypothetical protein [Rhodococcus sp. ARP2]|uniref:hypothetical protein n=1 Tax=Rhodococcus sp. ARP2 TaxID=1661385 RepID=UPI000AB5D552|nr:hypothetical protein [Rhodococcus sp. ARP2]
MGDEGQPAGSAGDGGRSNLRLAALPISAWFAALALVAFIGCVVLGVVRDDVWGTTAQSYGVPFCALAFGGFAADAYYRKEGERKVQEKVRLAAYTTLSIQYALDSALEPIKAAVEGAYNLKSMEQVGNLRAAEMAVHLAYGTSHQTLHELGALALDDTVISSVKALFAVNREALNATRPRVKQGDNPQASASSSDDSSGPEYTNSQERREA